MKTPIEKQIVDGLVAELGIKDFAKATIREVKQVAAKAEKASGVEFIKMESFRKRVTVLRLQFHSLLSSECEAPTCPV